jgi:conjugative transfer signal peptidase TraF
MNYRVQTLVPFYVMGIAAVLVPLTVRGWMSFGPTILVNETPSEPLGFYRLVGHTEGRYRRGMVVVFAVPHELRPLVYGRHWMRNGIPFLKEILGLAGDRICILNDRFKINDRAVGPVFHFDRNGQSLPQHSGCFSVPPGYFFAASQHIDTSFDGRYFGPLPLEMLQGEARPVWTF